MLTLFKYPRALVRNAAKLEQLQNQVFLPLNSRLENILGVTAFHKLGIEVTWTAVLEVKDGWKDVMGFSGDIVGPLHAVPSSAHISDIVSQIAHSLPNGISEDVKFEVILPVLMRNAKEHEPEIMSAWEKMEAAFLETMDKLRNEAAGIADALKAEFPANGIWDLSDTRPYIPL